MKFFYETFTNDKTIYNTCFRTCFLRKQYKYGIVTLDNKRIGANVDAMK